ncbi:recombinase family protein [Mariniphaga sediminis]|uniref:Recombinase family protein n=1 Tax=Mariniphaga sediminis TaxID=1628158 RepID=A0A399D6A5_9BACT|nr:recombinase family protein [Mariniphaga sediminis]RIH66172.1 recombinase family protein [Mariniphaga sediminis]
MAQRCAIYIRVSSDIQDYERQVSDLKSFVKDNNFIFEDKNLYEDKLSGFKDEREREGLAKLLKEVIASNIKIVLVWEMSRLARKPIILLELTDFFQNNSINVYFYIQRFWLLDETGKVSPQAGLSISVFGWLTEYEARLTKERFISAKTNNVKHGKYNGGKIPFGYTLDNENRFVVNDKIIESLDKSEADIVREVFDLYEDGLTCSKISRICRSKKYPKIVCNTHTLARVLRNTQYIGYKIVKLGIRPTPPLISKAQFNLVQELVESNKTKADKGKKHIFLLRGKLKCAVCGEYYVGKQTDDAYICPKNSGSNKTNKGTSCRGSNISISTLDGITWELVKENLINMPDTEVEGFFISSTDKIDNLKNQINEFQDLLKGIENRRKRTNIIFQNEGYSVEEYTNEIGKINNEKNECLRSIELYEQDLRYNERILEESNNISNRLQELDSISDRVQIKKVIKTIVREITFHKIGFFKTIVIIEYINNYKEMILYNAVAKKNSNRFKKLNYTFYYFNPDDNQFYALESENDIYFEAKTEYLKKNNIGLNLPDKISAQMFHGICRTSNLTDYDPYEIRIPHPRYDYNKVYSFDEMLLHPDDSKTSTHPYSKITYFKELKRERFNRKR